VGIAAVREGLKSGAVNATSLVENSLAAIERRDEELNTFVHVDGEGARLRAAEIDQRVSAGKEVGALAGVPIAVKDNIWTSSGPTTCASKIQGSWQPSSPATAVERLTDAGAIVIGKTNMDEFGMGSTTETSTFGPTLNPHDQTCVAGGSSGGSAAAVSAGLVMAALGSDTGGSIRQPAALCGVVGLKPTYGLVSRYGLVAYGSSLDQIGPLTTTVEDAALLLEAIVGRDERDATSLKYSPPNYAATIGDGVDGLKVGVLTQTLSDCEPAVTDAVAAAGESLSRAGALVDQVSLPELEYSIPCYYVIAPVEASVNLQRFDGIRYGSRVPSATVRETITATRTAGFGPEVKRRIMLGTYALSSGYYEAWCEQAQRVRTVIARALARVYETYDVLLTPVVPTTSISLEAMDDPLTMYISDRCTVIANLAGIPAVSVPFAADAKVPVGVQLMGRPLGEEVLLRSARHLEEHAQWTPDAEPAAP